MNPFKRFRVDYLLFGGFATFIIILLSVITFVNYSLTSREIADRTSIYQLELLEELSKQLQFQMKSVEQISLTITKNIYNLNYLSFQDDVYDRLQQQKYLDTVLKEFIYSNAIVHSMDLYVEGAQFPSLQGQVRYYDLSEAVDEPRLAVLENQDYSWMKQHRIVQDRRPIEVLGFARKMYTSAGQYYGLLVLNIKASSIQELIQGNSTESNRAVLDIRGRMLTYVGTNLLEDQVDLPLETMIGTSGSQRFIGELKQDVFITWSGSKLRQWTLVEVTPWNSITSTIGQSAKWMLLIGFISIVAALGFTLIFSKQFLKPIYFLIRFMDRFTPNYRVRLPSDYHNEFDHMFKGYQRLLERIDELYASLREQYKLQRETEIKALQAMINPHFLYNTLDQVNWIAIKAGQTQISHILSLMGKMFRIGLSNGKSFITIEDEIKHIELYLQIQQTRWGEGLKWDIQIPEQFSKLWIPKLTLQPFVENAVIHGFYDRTSGHLVIHAIQEEHDLVFTITDNGVGLHAEWDQRVENKGGYGIGNVKERLNAFFGDAYGVSISVWPQGGTQVVIRIPLLHDSSTYERNENNEDNEDNSHYR